MGSCQNNAATERRPLPLCSQFEEITESDDDVTKLVQNDTPLKTYGELIKTLTMGSLN